MIGDFKETTRPCPESFCNEGWDVYREWHCQTCAGKGYVVIEVCAVCDEDENSCRCFEEVKISEREPARKVA